MLNELQHHPTLRFCKVLKGTKKPFEKEWTSKPYTWEEIQPHIAQETNYGVLCGYGDLAVIDADTPELQAHIEKTLPVTLRIKTGSGGVHNYFFVPDLKEKIILTTGIGSIEKHWGEVQSYGSQVVGPGSIHPNGKSYEVLIDNAITTLTLAELNSAIAPFRKEIQEAQEIAKDEYKVHGHDIDELSVASIWGTTGMKKQGDEWYGSHPIHGSEGGMNFWINESKNTWHCFRCNSGGGPLSAIAVQEGIISCGESQRGALRGTKAYEALEAAYNKYGLQRTINEQQVVKSNSKEELTLWQYEDFEKLEKDNNFLVENVIYPKTVSMIYSPPGEFKSILALLMAMKIAAGKSWLGFETKSCPVLYCDKENNDQILKQRLMALYKGENFEDKKMPLYVLRRDGDLLLEKFIEKLKKAIKEKNIKLIVFDTLHRFADYDENKSDDINRLYTFVFQPIIEEFGCSIIFLHHTKKDGGYRGSGDFLGMVDTAYSVIRERSQTSAKTNRFRIVNEKCRSGEIETIIGEIDFGEDYIKILRLNQEVEEQNKISKIKELTGKIRVIVKPGELLKRKEIEERLELENFSYSIATLKRSLNWLVNNKYFDKNEKGEYSISV